VESYWEVAKWVVVAPAILELVAQVADAILEELVAQVAYSVVLVPHAEPGLAAGVPLEAAWVGPNQTHCFGGVVALPIPL